MENFNEDFDYEKIQEILEEVSLQIINNLFYYYRKREIEKKEKSKFC